MSEELTRVAILGGGDSAEAAVSRVSANAVLTNLKAAGYSCELFELDAQLARNLQGFAPDVVFPALHGPPGEDGTLQGFLELLGLAYVGSGVQGSAFAMDKSVAKALFTRAGLPVAADRIYSANLSAAAIAQDIAQQLGHAVVIKPMQQGSALGVTPLPEGGDLVGPITAALELGRQILVEPFVVGREMTVGVLDLFDAPAETFPVIEVVTAEGEWYDYSNRYTMGASEHIIPAEISAELTTELQQIALAAHHCLGLEDLSRADFILRPDNTIVLLEVNSLPGLTPTSLYPDGGAAAGYPFPELLSRLVESAIRRKRAG
jgi:D-alanine-D-alanine ligase